MKTWFTRIRQAVTGRLMTLKHKFGKPQLQKIAALLHARMQAAKDWCKEAFLVAKYGLQIFAIKLRMKLSPNALKGYWSWLKNLPSQFTRENLKKWAAAFLVWLRTLPETFHGLRKSGVLASLTLFALLLFMGHSATTAWITYTTPVAQNSFQVGSMSLYVEYSNDQTNGYKEMTPSSELFNNEVLYEPGYTQIVRLYVKNNGTTPFDYQFTVTVNDYADSWNVYNQNLHLPDYLKFGLITAASETALESRLANRKLVQAAATSPLGTHKIPGGRLTNGKDAYAALIVWMPEDVGNDANFRADATPPLVKLGVTVYAQQAGTMNG